MATPARSARGPRVAALVAMLLLALAATACTSSDPARAGADSFVDSYYVEINLPVALTRATGLARAKVEREMKLLDGVAAPEEGTKPRVHYRMVEEVHAAGSERRGFVYELTITLPGGEQIETRSLVTVGKDAEGWHAVNFEGMN